MAEYIEREKAIELLSQPIRMSMCLSTEECHHKIAQQRIDRYLIENIPAADVRPVVRGKWNRTDAYPHRLYCSVCYKTYLKNDELLERWEFPLNFCPNCGADMREEQDGR